MQIMDLVRQAGGGAAIETLARTYGVQPAEAEAVIATVVPEIARRLERQTLSRGGVADLVAALGQARTVGVLDDPSRIATPDARAQGVAFLDQVMGSKEASRAVAARAARASGLGEGLVQQMLPIILSLVMGAIAKAAQGGLGDILGRIPGLGGAGGGGTRSGGGARHIDPRVPMPEPGRTPRTGSGPAAGASPLPLPGEMPGGEGGNPYGDLSDAIRRGGRGAGGSGGAGGLVRDLLGGLLGFQSRGILSWIVRLIVMRWGWGLLQLVVRRMLGMR